VYVALDTAIGEICQHVGDHTLLFLVSGDGMGPNYSGSHLLTDLLGRMGLFNNMPVQCDTGGTTEHLVPAVGGPTKAQTDLLSTIRNMIPKQVRVAVSRAILPRAVNERLSLRWKTAGIVWEHTRAFLIENANEGYIRINLQGREPLGTVAPGKEYDDLCTDIVHTVKHMTNPGTGKRAALTVYKTDDIFAGPCRSHMPDIIIHWDEEARVTTELLTEQYGLVRSAHPGCALPPYYSGNHRPNAFALVVGPDIPCGELLEGAHILDLAPTLLTLFGISPPQYMDGKALTPLCSPGAGV
jgi:predicted AlkP superfamily phosphohydrolase/phosphomutase